MAILNKTNEQMKSEAQAQDDIDLVFEKTTERKLNSLVRKIVEEFVIVYAATGRIIDTLQYIVELQSLIIQAYRRTNSEFSVSYINDMEEALSRSKTDPEKTRLNNLIKIRDEASPIILLSLLAWSKRMAPVQSRYIVETWGKIIRKNVDDVVADLLLSEQALDNKIIAQKTKNPLLCELINHNKLIATQEIQTATENAKHTEVSEFNLLIKRSVISREIIKIAMIEKKWITMGDLRVREHHAIANGQRRNLNDPFLVGGELLKYPNDTSLGASVWNIINCRCKSIYL